MAEHPLLATVLSVAAVLIIAAFIVVQAIEGRND